jgi:hypothetical protein
MPKSSSNRRHLSHNRWHEDTNKWNQPTAVQVACRYGAADYRFTYYTNLVSADSRTYGGMLPFGNNAMKRRAIGCTAGEALCSVDLKGKNC